jgi:two-component system sensor histidine kinase BaeS
MACREKDSVRVEVHNTGLTIDPKHLPHIFERFYRGEHARQQGMDGHRGAGLGLAIARDFVKAHHGTITVESRPDDGTCFRFTVPTHPAV